MNVKSQNELINHLQLHFIELEKFDEKASTLMDRWTKFLKKAGEYTAKDLPLELQEIPTIKRAMEILDTMNLSPKEREMFEARLKWIRDEQAALLSMERRGFAKGREEGRQEGRQEGIAEGEILGGEKAKKALAKKLLGRKKLSKEEIAQDTGLSIEEINAIEEGLKS